MDTRAHWDKGKWNGNEIADQAAKEATGWRGVKRRNGKSVEINTNHTSTSPNLPFLRTAVKAFLAEKLYAEWEDDWHREARGRTLYKIVPTPSRKLLHLHDKLPKWVSSWMVQLRTGKIGLKKFLYERNVPSIEDTMRSEKPGTAGLTSVLSSRHRPTLRKQQGSCRKQASLGNFKV